MRSSARRLPGAASGGPAADAPAAGPVAPHLAPPWRAVAVTDDGEGLALVHRWMNEPHVARHWQQDWPVERWADEIATQLAGDHCRPWLVELDGTPVAYVEVYRAAADLLADHWPVTGDDLGVHIAIGDPLRTGTGLGPRVLRAVASGLFTADPSCRRVLGDPAVGHRGARAAFASAGFVLRAEVDLPHKRAAVMALDRDTRVAANGGAAS